MARAHAARSRRLSQAQGGGRGLVPRRASPRGWVRRTSWIIAADSIDLPVALRILAHQHREVHPRQHHLPQVVDVDADEAADLVDPANSLRADKLRRHPIVGALKEWARRRSDNARSALALPSGEQPATEKDRRALLLQSPQRAALAGGGWGRRRGGCDVAGSANVRRRQSARDERGRRRA